MKDLNNWQGIGRLGQDVQTPQGNGPAKFSVAVNDNVKKGDQWEDETSWIDIIYWHKSIIPKLTKGKQIAIQGRLRQEK
jgi:single stranded DNA-binding protein